MRQELGARTSSKLSHIEAEQEMMLSMNQSAGGAVLKKVYGIGAGGMSTLPEVQFVSPREGPDNDISSILLAGGARQRPKSRAMKRSKESKFFRVNSRRNPEQWSPRTQKRKQEMHMHPRSRERASMGLEISEEDFVAMYGEGSKARPDKAYKEEKRPYFVEHMALTSEEKSALIFSKTMSANENANGGRGEDDGSTAIAAGMDPDALEKERGASSVGKLKWRERTPVLPTLESAHGTIVGCLSAKHDCKIR